MPLSLIKKPVIFEDTFAPVYYDENILTKTKEKTIL